MSKKKRNPIKAKTNKVKALDKIQRAEANGRINSFNEELGALAERYQVKLDISQRIVVIDNKDYNKASQ